MSIKGTGRACRPAYFAGRNMGAYLRGEKKIDPNKNRSGKQKSKAELYIEELLKDS